MRFHFRRAVWALLVLVMPVCATAAITVLTDEPVAKFTLPDGTVLKNAYAWKRNSEGIMIIHDDGQFFLNFKTLPDDWREAYAIDESVEQVIPGAPKRVDQYSIYPILRRVPGVASKAVTFIESEKYQGDYDAELLSLCSLQALQDGNTDEAARLVALSMKKFPKFSAVDLSLYLVPCENCGGSGILVRACPECEGTGTCPKCNGTGEIESQFTFKADPLRCVDCRGEGKCSRCQGSGTLNYSCTVCQGKGRILMRDKLKEEIALQAARLNTFYENRP